ncbi:Necrosis inducing protein NPP1 [Phytophthora megakarya]|uniref:Necrosis inducing protein NPP1 n=1 Tax=Phytophthora megakarya TaxID=4795 RepID=A0A225VP32_9STRA|nr:Necrosis inducing protein NPP1 [Phytophthora megakarya]
MRVLAFLVVAVLSTINAASIDHDKVQPFAQPEPVTVTEKAAVKFKPSIAILAGCHPYPAVNAAGDISAGLKGTGPIDGDCKDPPLGSQVYSRSTWYNDKWAIMYAWYFPKDMQNIWGLTKSGDRHDWVNLVVWLDNPAIPTPTILATSVSTNGARAGGYTIVKPPKKRDIINGTTTKVRYSEESMQKFHTIYLYDKEGEYQDLIQWSQLTEAAREFLGYDDFGDSARVPFNDANFETNLKAASSLYTYVSRRRYYDVSSSSIWS